MIRDMLEHLVGYHELELLVGERDAIRIGRNQAEGVGLPLERDVAPPSVIPGGAPGRDQTTIAAAEVEDGGARREPPTGFAEERPLELGMLKRLR